MCPSARRTDCLSFQSSSRLLAALPEREYARFAPYLKPVDFVPGTALLRRDEPSDEVWFPGTAVISLLTPFADGRAIETALVGGEGLVGIHALLDTPVALHDAVVDLGGAGCRLSTGALREQMRQSERLRLLAVRYMHALFVALAQAAACNRVHSLHQRVCRWLLQARDRACADELPVTQELLAMRLGVRRAGVCEVMRDLREAGATDHRAGIMMIRDVEALESAACECYRIERAHYDAVFN